MFATTPEPPYTAVVFTSRRTTDDDGYAETAARMEALAGEQPGFLGIESARDAATGFGITVSYWVDEDAARAWKRVAEHVEAQRRGATDWYERYEVRIATVTRSYGAVRPPRPGREGHQRPSYFSGHSTSYIEVE